MNKKAIAIMRENAKELIENDGDCGTILCEECPMSYYDGENDCRDMELTITSAKNFLKEFPKDEKERDEILSEDVTVEKIQVELDALDVLNTKEQEQIDKMVGNLVHELTDSSARLTDHIASLEHALDELKELYEEGLYRNGQISGLLIAQNMLK
jgi:hypothetical protein